MSELASVVGVVIATLAAVGLLKFYSQRSKAKGLSGGPNGRAALVRIRFATQPTVPARAGVAAAVLGDG